MSSHWQAMFTVLTTSTYNGYSQQTRHQITTVQCPEQYPTPDKESTTPNVCTICLTTTEVGTSVTLQHPSYVTQLPN
eukprot:15107985-Ditylum_brightwellii.AAC.1